MRYEERKIVFPDASEITSGYQASKAVLSFPDLPSATVAAASLPNEQVVEVVDEQKSYSVEDGALVFVANLDQLRIDLADPTKGASIIWFRPEGLGAEPADVGTVLNQLRVNVVRFGADKTGVLDSGPAFRKAAAFLEARGGGELYVPFGLYRGATTDPDIEWPKDERHVFYIGSNTRVVAEKGARFWLDGEEISKLPLAGHRFNCIGIKKGAYNSSVNSVRFTTNGWVLPTSVFSTCYGVTVGGDDCTVEDCYFDNMPGYNMVAVGYNNKDWPAYNYSPVGVKILRNTFHNGSKNVPGNTLTTDCSFVYVNGHGATVEGNRFFNDFAPITNCGGVELHGSNLTAFNNEFRNCWPGIYTGYGTRAGEVSIGNKIHYNRFYDCVSGIQIIDAHIDLTIDHNTFVNVIKMGVAKGIPYAISSYLHSFTGVSAGALRGTRITSNTILEEVPINASVMSVAGMQASLISGNIVDGAKGLGVRGASDVDTDGVLVTDNIVRNPFANPEFFTGAFSASGSDEYDSVIKNVIFTKNLVIATTGTTNTYPLLASGTETTLSNVVYQDNTVVNTPNSVVGVKAAQVDFRTDDALSFSSAWTQASGTQPAIGNGSISFRYVRSGKRVDVWFKFTAGSTTTFGNGAVPWEFSLPFAASSSVSEQNATIEIYNGSAVMNFASLSVLQSSSRFRMNYQNQQVRLDWPFVSASGMIIRGQFSYFTN